ncbi:hypothetical protein SNEBB_011341, partial [Seison nebaliae]
MNKSSARKRPSSKDTWLERNKLQLRQLPTTSKSNIMAKLRNVVQRQKVPTKTLTNYNRTRNINQKGSTQNNSAEEQTKGNPRRISKLMKIVIVLVAIMFFIMFMMLMRDTVVFHIVFITFLLSLIYGIATIDFFKYLCLVWNRTSFKVPAKSSTAGSDDIETVSQSKHFLPNSKFPLFCNGPSISQADSTS